MIELCFPKSGPYKLKYWAMTEEEAKTLPKEAVEVNVKNQQEYCNQFHQNTV